MLIDTHFHLDLMENMKQLISEFQYSDIGIIAVGTTPLAYNREKQFVSGADNIHVGLGFHPQLIGERSKEIDYYLELADEARYLGEIGLDFNTGYKEYKDKQLDCFRKIVRVCAEKGGKIMSIHSVKAVGAVIDELNVAGTFKHNLCVFHWFTGTKEERKRAIELGAWFSINPRMLKTKSGQETIKALPTNRLLLETDSPFTMKFMSVNELKNELNRLLVGISELKGEDVSGQVERNSERILSF